MKIIECNNKEAKTEKKAENILLPTKSAFRRLIKRSEMSINYGRSFI
jgi:hypothetical protein